MADHQRHKFSITQLSIFLSLFWLSMIIAMAIWRLIFTEEELFNSASLILWGEMCLKPPNIEVILCGQNDFWNLEAYIPHSTNLSSRLMVS